MKLTDFGMMTTLLLITSVALLLSLEPAYAQTADYTDRTDENLFTFAQDVTRDPLTDEVVGVLPILTNDVITFTNVTLGNSGDGSYTNPYVIIQYQGTGDSTLGSPGNFGIQRIDVTVPKGFTTVGTTTSAGIGNYIGFDCDEDRTEIFDGSIGFIGAIEYPYVFSILPYVRQITLTNTDSSMLNPDGTTDDYNVCIAPEGLQDNFDYKDRTAANPNPAPVLAYTPPTGWSITPESRSTVNFIQPDEGSAIKHYARVVLTPAAGDQSNINATGNELIAEVTTFTRYNAVSGSQAPNGIDTLTFEAPFFDAPITVSLGGGGSGGNIAQSKPHFGESPLTHTQLVSCGFSMDGECRDVVDYHVPYERTTIQTGTTHDFTLKPFNNYSLKMLQLGLGVEKVGDPINTAEALITVELAPDYKSEIGYTIESVNTENNLENVIDEVTESNVSLSTEPCMTGLKKDCLVVHINDVMFRDVFYSEPFVINVVDTKRLSSTNYLNEGIIVTGESLNPAPEYHLTTGKKVQQVVERLNLVRTDKVNDIWTDNNGNQWTQNSHDTWIQVTFTPYVEPQDPTMSVMTRINNNFDGIILQERERAILVWDSSMIQGEIKPSFSYTFDEKLDKLDDPKILKKLDIESEKALEILRAANYNFQDTD